MKVIFHSWQELENRHILILPFHTISSTNDGITVNFSLTIAISNQATKGENQDKVPLHNPTHESFAI